MTFESWIEEGAIYVVVLAALSAGMAAAYGRELEAGRRPDRRWWLRRILIIPFLAITSTAAADAFGLSAILAAFTAAMFSLGGYDGLCLLEARWKRRLGVSEADASGKGAGEGGCSP